MPPEFKLIPRNVQDAVATDFRVAISSAKALHCSDLDETADAVEAIGLKLRCETSRGALMLAKAIIDRAVSANH